MLYHTRSVECVCFSSHCHNEIIIIHHKFRISF
ncbi:unnamed protein product [Spirodela intermedia]|uniref:Uncharacterized protein n=1 Tax=Spirodela intermedia TaxID=51605 RepID=A0A7I8K6V8_SPIIN|nr:unnamed protein product [Spirodela intermedia]